MLLTCAKYLFGTSLVLFSALNSCGQFVSFRDAETTKKPLPFPTCRADDLECLRRGLRTFFFLMNSEYLGMTQIDPMTLNSITISLPEERMGFLLRRVNVSGAQWTKLIDRRYFRDLAQQDGLYYLESGYDTQTINSSLNSNSNASNSKQGQEALNSKQRFDAPGRNSVRFFSDLHVTGDLSMTLAERADPYAARLTMDIGDVESNITYAWTGERGTDDKAYIIIGRDRIVVRNSRTPTFFLEPESADTIAISEAINIKPSILEHISNEITMAIMQTIVENFRYFTRLVPAKEFYQLNLM